MSSAPPSTCASSSPASPPPSSSLPTGDDESHTLADVVADEGETPEALAHASLLAREADQTLTAVLTTREKLVVQMRFGMGDRNIYPLEAIGRRLGLTRERVRQIEKNALWKLRAPEVTDRLRAYLSA